MLKKNWTSSPNASIVLFHRVSLQIFWTGSQSFCVLKVSLCTFCVDDLQSVQIVVSRITAMSIHFPIPSLSSRSSSMPPKLAGSTILAARSSGSSTTVGVPLLPLAPLRRPSSGPYPGRSCKADPGGLSPAGLAFRVIVADHLCFGSGILGLVGICDED